MKALAKAEDLTDEERADFEHYRARFMVIAKTWIEVGDALQDIRDRRLYRAQFATFEAFCRIELGMGRSNVNRLLQSTELARRLATLVAKPVREAHVRPLLRLTDPKEQVCAFSRALERANQNNKPLTGSYVARVVRESLEDFTTPSAQPSIHKADILTRVTRALARGLEKLEVEELETFEKALAEFKSTWLQTYLHQTKPPDGAGATT